MHINADFSKRVLVHTDELEWLDSPMPGVSRRMLDRVGGEVARATSIVRYASGSHFSPHVHGGGEEFLVLDGVFQDEHGDFPASSYIRNPPTSKHTPGSEPGCIIFVKLHQFDPDDRTHVRIDANKSEPVAHPNAPEIKVLLLHQDERETVSIQNWSSNEASKIDSTGGAELLVLEGELFQQGDCLRKHSWLRLPDGVKATAKAGPDGVLFWLKQGHLRFVDDDLAQLQI